MLLHFVVLSLGILTAFHPTILSRGRLLQTDPGDTLLNHYVLEHGWKWLTDHKYPGSLWSPPFFYPEPNVLTYSENLLGVAPVYWALRICCDEIMAYQLWMIVVAALTYIAMAWVLIKLQTNQGMAALGAFVWAFGMPRVSQLNHQQLLPAMYCPLAVYYLVRTFETKSLRSFMLLLLFTWCQLASSIYVGWFLILGMGIFSIVYCVLGWFTSAADVPCDAPSVVMKENRVVSADRISLILMWLVFGVATAWLLTPYIHANHGFRRSYQEVRTMLPTWQSWFSPPPGSLWAHVLPSYEGASSHEHHLFPGATFVFLAACAVVAGLVKPMRLHRPAWAALATALVLMLISLQIDKISAWHVVFRHVPGANGIRAVTRIVMMVTLFGWMGLLLSIRNWKPAPTPFAQVGIALILGFGIAEQWQPRLPSFDPQPFFVESRRLADEMSGANAVYVEPDTGTAKWVNELSAMWAGLYANVPVVNGYSGRQPANYPVSFTGPTELAEWLGTCQNVKVIGPARLAHAYPMPHEQHRPVRFLHAHRGD